MNRYEKKFKELSTRNEAAFIPFAVAGDPNLEVSERILKTYVDAGADVLEIGYPFSDPVADGPVNQRAGMRAISSGLTHERFFDLIRTLRAYTDIPMGALLYANTAMHIGYEKFCRLAGESGLDSLLVADMPPEEALDFEKAARANGLSTVYIVSELTPPLRMAKICKKVTGFVYVVSRLGPTGVQQDLGSAVRHTLSQLKACTKKPLCVGFGLSTPDHVRSITRAGADGAIVGSALVKIIEEEAGNPEAMLTKLADRVSAYKHATLHRND